LLDVVDERFDVLAGCNWVVEIHLDEDDEQSHDAAQHAVFVSQVFLEDHCEFDEYF
jgi:hypothetical protein